MLSIDFSIDPHAWMVALPLTAMMLWVYFQPADHAIKRVWHELKQLEALGWAAIAPVDADRAAETQPVHRAAFWCMVGLSALGGASSLAAFLGII